MMTLKEAHILYSKQFLTDVKLFCKVISKDIPAASTTLSDFTQFYSMQSRGQIWHKVKT